MTPEAQFAVREAEASDAESIARVHVDSWRETYAGVLGEDHFSEAAFSRRLQFWTSYLSLAPRPGQMIVAELDDVVVGFACAGEARGPDAEHGFVPARALHLFSIYLREGAHGGGLGQLMIDAALRDEPAQLWVLRGNQRAIAFYRRNGFEADGVEFIDPADPNLVTLRMIR